MKTQNNKKILAIIPARGGSRGVPGKNIRLFCGKPLIFYTIDPAKKSGIFDRIVVSTDSAKIAGIGRKFGAEVPFLRPKRLAQDKSNVVDAVLHLLDYLSRKENYQPDYIFLLQPTSPLRSAEDIVAGWNFCRQRKAKAVVSVCSTSPQIFNIREGKLALINKEACPINRQEREQVYRQDGGALFIIETKHFLAKKDFMPAGTFGYVIPQWKSVDIDEPEDFALAEVLYRKKNYFKKFNIC